MALKRGLQRRKRRTWARPGLSRFAIHPLIVMVWVLLPAAGVAQEVRFDRDSRTRGLVGGWAHSWRPLFG